MNLSFKSKSKTSEMMRRAGLEPDSGVCREPLLQSFTTQSLQFNRFLMAIIQLSTAKASIIFAQ
jgi:hypothetical protein